AEHRPEVFHRLKTLGGLATHALGRGIGGDKLGIGCFQCLEFTVQSVVLGVTDTRAVLNVVLILMQMNHLTQLVQALHDCREVFHSVPYERRVRGELRGAERPRWRIVCMAIWWLPSHSRGQASVSQRKPCWRTKAKKGTALTRPGSEK